MQAQRRCGKPVLSCFMGGGAVRQANTYLTEQPDPELPLPGARGEFARRDGPLPGVAGGAAGRPELPIAADQDEGARRSSRRSASEGRLALGEMEAREVLLAYGLAMPDYRLATSAEEAAQFAEEIGFPVVMKIVSPDILHKSDIGGVKVGIADRQQAMDTFELMLLRAKRFMPNADLRGVSVQQMVQTGREVIVGLDARPAVRPAGDVRPGRDLRRGAEGRRPSASRPSARSTPGA